MPTRTDVSMTRMISGSQAVGAQVLVVDQDDRVQKGITELLAAARLHVSAVKDLDAALELCDRHFFSVMLVDLDTPTPGSGIETVRALKQKSPTSSIIALTPRRSYDDATAAIRAGAIDMVLKAPDSVAYLESRVLEAVGRSMGTREVDSVLNDIRSVHEEFLQKFVDAEKRALDLVDRLAGRDPNAGAEIGELAVLIVDEVDELFDALTSAHTTGYTFVHATSGGEALDRVTSGRFHYALVAEDMHDLPTSMIVRSLKGQNEELVVLTFRGPAENGRVQLIETASERTIIEPFTDPQQMVERMSEFAEAFKAKSRERRYMQNFRERHYDFLRRYVDIKVKIERALHEGPG
jgi:DNA-binding response OmpR family regulator